MIELTLKADRRLTADRGRDTHIVLLSFRAPRLERQSPRPGLNVSLVLDRSGSMAADSKLPLAVSAAELALARLGRQDRFALVAYNHVVDVVVPSTQVTPEALNESRLALHRVVPAGNTALFDGYLRGAEQVAQHLGKGDLGKVLLLTDGLANVGLQDATAISQHVAELRERGVLTSTFGVGADFNQLLLEGMAHAGGGNFYFAQSATQLEDQLTSEVGEALETVARDVRVAVEHSNDVQVRLLDAFAAEPRPGGLISRLGPLTSEQLVELVYEVDVPGLVVGEVSSLKFAISDADNVFAAPSGVVEFRHAAEADVEAESADADVVHRAARRVRLDASEAVLALNYEGRQGEVRQEASKALDYLKRLAKQNPRVAELVSELERDVAEAEMPMGAMALKVAYYKQILLRRGRDATGKVLKKTNT